VHVWTKDYEANHLPRSVQSARVQGPSLIRILIKRRAAVRGAEAWSKRNAGEEGACKMRVIRKLLDKIQMLPLLINVESIELRSKDNELQRKGRNECQPVSCAVDMH
jgi:hypothetical protein